MTKAPALSVASTRPTSRSPDVPGEITVEGIAAVEDLLDWLEVNGAADIKVVALDDSHFLVMWHSH